MLIGLGYEFHLLAHGPGAEGTVIRHLLENDSGEKHVLRMLGSCPQRQENQLRDDCRGRGEEITNLCCQ